MKSLTKAIAVASLATVATVAHAEDGASLSVGAVTDYYFRGVNLGDAGAYASLDYTVGGFYFGVWAIDDGGASASCGTDASGNVTGCEASAGNDGLETDFYLGYATEIEGVALGLGYTRYEYTYTSNFEHELNLNVGVAGFGLDFAYGEADDEDGTGDEADYTVIELSYANGPYGAKVGSYDRDEGDDELITEAEYKWIEASYSAEVGTFDVTATIGHTFDVEDDGEEESSEGNNYLVLDVSKSFDL